MHQTARKPRSLTPNRSAAILLAATLQLPVTAQAMRCGNHLISTGDTQAKVLRYCGEPVQASRSLGLRSGVYFDNRRSGDPERELSVRSGYYLPYGRREVVVEDWVFNLGPSRLMRQVRFENGIVTTVTKLGYGYRD